jgi:hypothetical protein
LHAPAKRLLSITKGIPCGVFEEGLEKTYSESTPASSFTIDEPGFSDIITVNQLRDRIDRPDPRNLQG